MTSITARTLSQLPRVHDMILVWQNMAIFEAIMERDRDWRVFDFVAQWTAHAMYGRIDTRQGDCITAVFTGGGALIQGYNEAAALLVPGEEDLNNVLRGVPESLRQYALHPDMDCGGYTFCLLQSHPFVEWRATEFTLRRTPTADCVIDYLGLLCGHPADFEEWALEYYMEAGIANMLKDLIRSLVSREPLCERMTSGIDLKGRPFSAILRDAHRIGYPVP